MRIRHFLFEISPQCNFHCLYCYFTGRKFAKTLSTEEAKKLLKFFRKNFKSETVGLTGGEPFLRNDIFGILKYAKSIGYKTAIGTNGSLISTKNIGDIRKYVDTLIVGYDGPQEFFSYITRSKTWHRIVIKNLNLLKNEKVNFGLHINITPQNLEYFDLLIKRAEKLGARFIQIGDIHKTSTIKRNNSEINRLELRPKERQVLFKKILIVNKIRPRFIIHNLISKKEFQDNKKLIFSLRKYISPFFVVEPDGSLYPMVDLEEKWRLTKNVLKNEIDYDKLKKYLSRMRIAAKLCQKRLDEKNVINPYSVIKESLK